uniref:Uncharacterized protein n=1 Tax=Salix viminalis TaxID=40686 RepID=A0A6N2KAH0_SALVM
MASSIFFEILFISIHLAIYQSSGPFSFCQQLQSPKNLVVKAIEKQVELVYDPDGWINNLADEIKKCLLGQGLVVGVAMLPTALWVANQFSGCPATEKELQEWSSEIGSNIPFFFSHGTTCCTGRGEYLWIENSSPPPPPHNKHVQLQKLYKSKLFLHYASLTSKASQLEYARTPFPPQRPISLIVRQIIGINILLQVQQFVTLRLNFPALSSELASLVV